MSVTFVCVNAGNYLGRGAEYVNILFDSVMRNLPMEKRGRFVCFTDDNDGLHHGIETRALPHGLKGWFNKLWLFKRGHFEDGERLVFLDLDTVIMSNIQLLVDYRGDFAILRDFFRPDGYGSGVMAWEANTYCHIWDDYEAASFPDIEGGDQIWIEPRVPDADRIQDLFPGLVCSYKVERGRMPEASICCFHGLPRPHEVDDDWVRQMWRVGGRSRALIVTKCNTDGETLFDNVRSAMKRDIPWHVPVDGDNGPVCIVGGGPSLKGQERFIQLRQASGHKVWAINGAYNHLLAHGIVADAMVMTDARKENAQFLKDPRKETTFYLASQCAPELFDALEGYDTRLIHLNVPGVPEVVMGSYSDRYTCFLAAPGGTTGMAAMYLAESFGHCDISLYGLDSCYTEGEHHAFSQPLNDGERIIDVWCGERKFRCAPWMAEQARAFSDNLHAFIQRGCTISAAGDGLLAEIIRQSVVSDEIVVTGGMHWPANDERAYNALKHDIKELPEIIDLHVKNRSAVVQAGGNCGLWPQELAKHFEAVYTFEPDRVNFGCLVENTRDIDNVIRIQSFIGSDKGTGGLQAVDGNCGAGYKNGPGIIPTFRIDELNLPDCGAIILDVEGMEYDAIMGAEKTIRRFSPTIICEEKGQNERYGVDDGAINRFLSGLGYREVARHGRDRIYVNHSKQATT